MKRILSICLVFVTLFLCSCSLLPVQREGLVEIEGFDEGIEAVCWVAFDGDTMAAITSNRRGEEEYYYGLSLINTKSASVVKSADLSDCPLKDFDRVEFSEDGNIKLVYGYEKKYVLFNRKLEQVGDVQSYTEEEKTGFEGNRLFDNTIAVYGDCMHFYNDFEGFDLINAVGFKGENETLTFVKNERFTPLDSKEKLVLGSYPDLEAGTDIVSVYDFESDTVINRFNTVKEEGMSSVCVIAGRLSENCAYINIEYGDGDPENGHYYNKYYLWYFRNGALNEAFEAESFTYDSLNQENSKLCTDIKTAYGINVYIDKENEDQPADDEVYGYTFGLSPLKAYVLLKQLTTFLSWFPDGFVKEMYQGFNDNIVEFSIYIVNDIKGFPSAYANSYMDRFYITFEGYNCLPETIYHEFMHIIERRIEYYYDETEESMFERWESCNPKGFEYIGYDDESDIDFSQYEDYFPSFYSMNAMTEDMAETFTGMLGAGLEGRAPFWYKKGTPLAEKAKFLADSIRRAYPSMKYAPPQPWEKYIN